MSQSHVVKPTAHPEEDLDTLHAGRLAELDRIATILDSQWRIPGTGIRFGMDAVAGLIPGIGDAGAALVSGLLILRARKLGAPAHLIGRMAGNVALDTIVGSVPVLGSIIDVFYKANRRNIHLLRRHLEREHRRRKQEGAIDL